ncbi:MAG: hypothetical protein V4864_12795 [Pseudomonadota bacterium]
MLKFFRTTWRTAALAALLGSSAAAIAAPALGPAALRQRHASLAPQLAANALGMPLHMQSAEAGNRLEGDVYAVLEHPFAEVSAALGDPARWCDVLILHLNTKQCSRVAEGGRSRIDLRVGKKVEQSPQNATLLSFAWQPPAARQDYLDVEMRAPEGPYDTRDYQLMAEAVPLEGGRTFLHLGYSFAYGGASQLAMQMYLATVGRDKVGFTVAQPARAGQQAEYVGGMRGVVERNTMRYYLAIQAYLDSLSAPPAQQLDKRLQGWFDATEKYPRQLREVDRDAYLRMKRNEWQRQARSS